MFRWESALMWSEYWFVRFCCSKVSWDQSEYFAEWLWHVGFGLWKVLPYSFITPFCLKVSGLFSKLSFFVSCNWFTSPPILMLLLHEPCCLAASCALTFAYAWGGPLQSMQSDILPQLCWCSLLQSEPISWNTLQGKRVNQILRKQ